MKKLLILVITLFSFFVASCGVDIVNPTPDEPVEPTIEELVDKKIEGMSLEEKVSQMIMIACRSFGGANLTVLTDEMKQLFEDYSLNGMILYAQNIVYNEQTFNLTKAIKEASSKEGRPGLFLALDQEGGRVTRLEYGTGTPGNMALGAVEDNENVKKIAEIIAKEVKALGFNVDFAPVVDVNNNPNNPVIGTRSFSDDPNIVAEKSKAYLEGLKEYNIIGSLKHFPGHGDTNTDSHTGLPVINKTLDEIKEVELVPYLENIKDIEMIMSAHIEYPLIETETYRSTSTNNLINLPATLSKKIINDVLREELDYEGVVVTDALEMDAIAKHFNKLDVAKLAINAGVDILLMPVDISGNTGINNLKEYINDVVNLVNNGDIEIEKVNAAVKRILTLKARHGLLDGNLEQNADELNVVGSKEHHNIENEVALKSVTLVKNNNVFPLKASEKVLVVADSTFMVSCEYGFELAGRKLNNDFLDIADIDEANAVNKFNDYDVVIFISNMANAYYFSNTTAVKYDKLITIANSNNKKTVVLSVNLPYDVARFQHADGLVLCYNPKITKVNPLSTDNEIPQYGPNIPMAISLILSDTIHFVGHLPVEIKALDNNYQYTDQILYERGFGITE